LTVDGTFMHLLANLLFIYTTNVDTWRTHSGIIEQAVVLGDLRNNRVLISSTYVVVFRNATFLAPVVSLASANVYFQT